MSQYKNILSELNNYVSPEDSKIQEANWMMDIDKITTKSSTNSAHADFCTVHDMEFAMTRTFESGSAHSVRPDGGLKGYDLKVVVPSSSITAALDVHFAENEIIKTIQIFRLITLAKKQEPTEKYTFTDCFITGILTKADILCIAFRYSQVQRESLHYKIADNKISKAGTHTAIHNFLHSTSSGK